MQDDWWEAESLNNLIKYVSGFRQQQPLSWQGRNCLGRNTKWNFFMTVRKRGVLTSQHHQVLVFSQLPLVSSPFRAKFMGPCTVVRHLSDRNA